MKGERLEVRGQRADPVLRFPIFFFPNFPLFRPPSRRFAFFAGQNALVDPIRT